ncbi:DUF89 family protein [Oscillospiraceae bacterium NSJ-54]|uniref:DUF89 family protein n=1 Tax=Zongyangia hominis TaxID=2763677 RepID=A0A926EDB0_9FIRM|nr:DUF89 family protein [Zongyangia hominis]
MSCIVRREEEKIRPLSDETLKKEYMVRVLGLLSEHSGEPAPVASVYLKELGEEMLGATPSFREINKGYNRLMLLTEPDLREKIAAAKDPLSAAMRYARVGNYIDFGAMENVDKEVLEGLLDRALEEELDPGTYAAFLADLEKAERLVYLTDNCGEIVADKLLIEELKRRYPGLSITAVVRGAETINDATLIDAEEVGLTDVVPVMGSGVALPGTYLPFLSGEARDALTGADVIIAKGQGNFETLHECGLNIYYLFLCKCELFTRRFGMKQYAGIFANERRILL